MNIIENLSSVIVDSLGKNDIKLYEDSRNEMITKIANQDFFNLEGIENYFTVGKALTLILDDMYKNPPLLYKRVVLCATYCLLKAIINDKYDKEERTVHASALLYILFSENDDFIGREYLMSKLRNNVQAAAFQFRGMQSVFYWKYKLSNYNIQFSPRIEQRLTNAISSAPKIPDENNRQKIINFEYENFPVLLDCIPMDIEIRYHGVFIDPFDSDIFARLKSVFKPNTFNFPKKEPKTKRDTEISYTETSTLINKRVCIVISIIIIVLDIVLLLK